MGQAVDGKKKTENPKDSRLKTLSFATYKSLARWLTQTNAGRRFIDWFVRGNRDLLLGLPVGAELHDYVRESVMAEMNDTTNTNNTITVLIESIPDSVIGDGVHLRVFTSKFVSVVFADRLLVEGRSSRLESMAMELIKIELPFRAKGLYDESQFLRASHHCKVVDVRERQACDFENSLHRKLDGIIKKCGIEPAESGG